MRQATGFRSLAKASHPSRSASSGIDPPPAKGSTTKGVSSGWAAFTSPRAISRYVRFDELSQSAKSPMKCRRAARRSVSLAPISPVSLPSRDRAVALNSTGQWWSAGSGSNNAMSMERQAPRGRRAHQRCSVEGWPWRIDFSLAECFETTAIGKSTSARRLHSLGIMACQSGARPSGARPRQCGRSGCAPSWTPARKLRDSAPRKQSALVHVPCGRISES